MTTLPPLTLDEALDARVEPGQFDTTLIVSLQRLAEARRTTTRDTLTAMRETTPRLRTLTVIDVLYDIVTAIRRRSE
jgi:hypothetical protein